MPPVQLLVWKGEAGSPALLMRLGLALRCRPNWTCLGEERKASAERQVEAFRALWPSLSLAVGKYFGDVVAANCFGT